MPSSGVHRDWPSRVAKKTKRFAAETKALGLRIRALRQARGWTLQKTAEASHLDLTHLQKVEAGKLNVGFVTLVRIAEGLEVDMAALFTSGWVGSKIKK